MLIDPLSHYPLEEMVAKARQEHDSWKYCQEPVGAFL